MPEVKIDEGISKPLIGGTDKAPSVLSTVINVVREVNTLINTINNNPFVKRLGEGSNAQNVMQSTGQAKSIKMPTQQPQQPQQQTTNDQDLTAFFSTPEGLNTIVEAIDQIIPFVGDVKLSELKEVIKESGGKKDAENEPDPSKNGAGEKPKKSKKSKNSKSRKSKSNK